MHIIRSNDLVKPALGKMVVEAPYVVKYRKPGQFIILRIDEVGERIPLTIADVDKEKDTITLYYQVVGTTTQKLSVLKAGDALRDIAGPLGHPTEIKNYGTVVCIGGGIGTAPLYPIARAMNEAGNRVITIIGARTEDLLMLTDKFETVGEETIICTDDGSSGRKAFVTDPLKEIMAAETIDAVVAIGPVPMMKAVSELTREKKILTVVSLNAIMIDGTGMCGGCRVTINGETKFTCVDGPEFNGHEVNFDELVSRLGTYRIEETVSKEKHQHKCKIGLGK